MAKTDESVADVTIYRPDERERMGYSSFNSNSHDSFFMLPFKDEGLNTLITPSRLPVTMRYTEFAKCER